jgi:hypothetical protein
LWKGSKRIENSSVLKHIDREVIEIDYPGYLVNIGIKPDRTDEPFPQQKQGGRKMGVANSLNTKEITRCTLRFYDSDFAKKLNELYAKIGGTQTAFLGMLVKEGYKVVSPMYANVGLPVSASVKEANGEKIDMVAKEIKDLLAEKSDVEMKNIANLAEDHETMMKFLACIYNLFILTGIDDKSMKEIIDSGGFDRIPKRFLKMRNLRK